MANVLVTGGAGSMGQLVCATLAAAGHLVTAFDLASANFAPLEGIEGVSNVAGDLGSRTDLEAAVAGAERVVHLAAILPPVADARPELARAVNVDGTRNLVDAVAGTAPSARIIFSSSVSVYGRPGGQAVTGADAQLNPDDVYATTKAEAEDIVRESGLEWVALRISGVAVPVFQDPPEAWPFLAGQPIEFVHRDDAVAAIVGAVDSPEAAGKVYNISGGETWRMAGARYVADYFNMIEVDPADAVYQSQTGHFSYYDPGDGPETLGYRNNTYQDYLEQLQADIDRLMAG